MKLLENHLPARHDLINGLRGIAVLLVLGYHYNLPLFENGFWGVDLFFWISGFLITGGFLREYSENRESNHKFGWIDVRYYFLRRIKRILPLSLTILVTVFSFIYAFGDFQSLTQTVRRLPAILTFTFNLQLQNDSRDYFLNTNQDFGLLHYWSLSIEEQIYILSPFIFLLATSFHGIKILGHRIRWHQRVLGLNLVLFAISFIFMISQNRTNPIPNYYSTFSRFWEFSLGSIVAVLWFQGVHKRVNPQLTVYLSQLSSVIFVLSFFTFANKGYGPLVLIPLFAISIFALLNLSVNKKRFFAKVLRIRLVQFLGNIAFPLYLVHWPAMIFLHHTKYHSSLLNVLLFLLFIVVLSYLLHRYIEKPVMAINIDRFKISQISMSRGTRHHRGIADRKILTIVLIAIFITLTLFGYPKAIENSAKIALTYLTQNRYGTLKVDSIPKKSLQEQQRKISEYKTPSNDLPTDSSVDKLSKKEFVASGKTDDSVVGSVQSTRVLEKSWAKNLQLSSTAVRIPPDYRIDQADVYNQLRDGWNSGCLDSKTAASACTFGTGDREAVLLGDSFSYAFIEALRGLISPDWKLRVLTKGSCLPWNLVQYGSNGEINQDCADHTTWVNSYIVSTRPDLIIATGADQWIQKTSIQTWHDGFESSVRLFKANTKKLVILSSVPGSGNLKDCLSNNETLEGCFGTPKLVTKFIAIQQSIAQTTGYTYLNLLKYLCYEQTCPAIVQNVPVYADGSHLSGLFAKKLSPVFKSLKLFY